MWRALCVVVILAAILGETHGAFPVSDCSRNKRRPFLKLSHVTLDPYPLRMPGSLRVAVVVKLYRPLTRGVILQTSMTRTVLWLFKYRCRGNFGSCVYRDFCSLLAKVKVVKAPSSVTRPLKCPLPAGEYILEIVTRLQDPAVHSYVFKGRYDFVAMLKDPRNGQELTCQEMELIVK